MEFRLKKLRCIFIMKLFVCYSISGGPINIVPEVEGTSVERPVF